MSPFIIYTFEITDKDTQGNLFSDQQLKEAVAVRHGLSSIQYFESLFPKKNGTMELSISGHENGNKFEQCYGHVVLFLLQADKTKTVENKNFTKEHVPHKPSGRVIIDFRPDRKLILIEKKSDALKSLDAISFLQTAFNHLLAPANLQFNYQQYNLKSASFWNTVDIIKNVTKSTIRRVQFDFVSSSGSSGIDPLAIATSIIPVEDADHGSIIVESDGNKDLAFIQRREDMEHMINLCSKQGYNLTVYFRQFGLFRYGMDIEAQLGVDDKIIDDFIEGKTYFDLESENKPTTIFDWLDNCFEIITKNGERVNGIPAPKKRKKKS